jgi:predicted AAA+ superfamily ATPase
MDKLQDAWRRVPIAWLSGVRRVGKTTLQALVKELQHG